MTNRRFGRYNLLSPNVWNSPRLRRGHPNTLPLLTTKAALPAMLGWVPRRILAHSIWNACNCKTGSYHNQLASGFNLYRSLIKAKEQRQRLIFTTAHSAHLIKEFKWDLIIPCVFCSCHYVVCIYLWNVMDICSPNKHSLLTKKHNTHRLTDVQKQKKHARKSSPQPWFATIRSKMDKRFSNVSTRNSWTALSVQL